MKKNVFVLFITTFALVLLINSCASPDATMESWLGHQINQVILKWGPADDVQPDGQGGKVYTWYYQRQYSTASRTFLCDENGRIYAYRWRGL